MTPCIIRRIANICKRLLLVSATRAEESLLLLCEGCKRTSGCYSNFHVAEPSREDEGPAVLASSVSRLSSLKFADRGCETARQR